MTDEHETAPEPEEQPTEQPGEESDRTVRDAQRYRKRAQEAETERDELRGQLDTMRRQAIEARLPFGVKPAAFWAAGAEVSTLLGEDGAVDAALVDAEVQRVREMFGIDNRGPIVPTAGDVPTKHPTSIQDEFLRSLMSKS